MLIHLCLYTFVWSVLGTRDQTLIMCVPINLLPGCILGTVGCKTLGNNFLAKNGQEKKVNNFQALLLILEEKFKNHSFLKVCHVIVYIYK